MQLALMILVVFPGGILGIRDILDGSYFSGAIILAFNIACGFAGFYLGRYFADRLNG